MIILTLFSGTSHEPWQKKNDTTTENKEIRMINNDNKSSPCATDKRYYNDKQKMNNGNKDNKKNTNRDGGSFPL